MKEGAGGTGFDLELRGRVAQPLNWNLGGGGTAFELEFGVAHP